MLDIIVASKDKEKTAQTRRVWNHILSGQTQYALHIVEGAPSIIAAYREGEKLANKKSDCWIFAHDDTAPLTQDFWPRLKKHLESCEVVGACGATRLAGPRWLDAGPGWIHGQVLNLVREQKGMAYDPAEKKEVERTVPQHFGLAIFGVSKRLQPNICVADGFFLAALPMVLQWDTRYTDWHFYDVDATYNAYYHGYTVGVASDLHLLHMSTGGYGLPGWTAEMPKFLKKWESCLPPQPFQRNPYGSAGEMHLDVFSAVEAMERYVRNCEV